MPQLCAKNLHIPGLFTVLEVISENKIDTNSSTWVHSVMREGKDSKCPDVQAGFRKGRGTRDQIANIHWVMEKARVPEKHLFLLYWLCQSLWQCVSQ